MPAPTKPRTDAGRYVRHLREGVLDLNQIQFGELIHYDQSQVSAVETGASDLSPEFAAQLVRHTPATWDDVMPLVSQKRPFLDAVMLGAPSLTLTPLAA